MRTAWSGEIIGYSDYIDEKGRHARLFEAQVATKCMLALFSRDHITQLRSGLPSDALVSIIASLNTFWSENLRAFRPCRVFLRDRLTMVMSDLAKQA